MNDIPLFRPTWATIDLSALRHNYSEISKVLPENVKMMAMVKADAYGHGAVRVSRVLEGLGVRALGVATVEEGIDLRDAGIKSEIVVMGGLMGAGSPASKCMVEYRLAPVVHSDGVLDSLEEAASAAGRTIDVHLKVDTGMSRLGVRPESLRAVIAKLSFCSHLRVEGVMTHLADAGDEDFSREQFELFLSCRERIEKELGPIRIWHAANSAAVFGGQYVSIDGAAECWVRPGLALYGECEGVDPSCGRLKPVMGLVSRAVLLKRVPSGTRVSYCGEFTTSRPSRLAIVPIGYADGYPWSMKGRAKVLIRGMRLPVVGRITMDMIMVDATDAVDISVNEEVVLMGSQGDERIPVREFADWAGTIPYEIFCGVSKRMPRIYLE